MHEGVQKYQGVNGLYLMDCRQSQILKEKPFHFLPGMWRFYCGEDPRLHEKLHLIFLRVRRPSKKNQRPSNGYRSCASTASATRLRSAIVFTGACFASRLSAASCVAKVSPSETPARAVRASFSIRSIAS